MSLLRLQARLRDARGDRSRAAILEIANGLPGAPDGLSEARYRALEIALQGPPRDGAEFRAFVAALGVDYLDALEDLAYWPPLPSPYARKSVAERLLDEAARLGGWKINRAGGRIVIDLS